MLDIMVVIDGQTMVKVMKVIKLLRPVYLVMGKNLDMVMTLKIKKN